MSDATRAPNAFPAACMGEFQAMAASVSSRLISMATEWEVAHGRPDPLPHYAIRLKQFKPEAKCSLETVHLPTKTGAKRQVSSVGSGPPAVYEPLNFSPAFFETRALASPRQERDGNPLRVHVAVGAVFISDRWLISGRRTADAVPSPSPRPGKSDALRRFSATMSDSDERIWEPGLDESAHGRAKLAVIANRLGSRRILNGLLRDYALLDEPQVQAALYVRREAGLVYVYQARFGEDRFYPDPMVWADLP